MTAVLSQIVLLAPFAGLYGPYHSPVPPAHHQVVILQSGHRLYGKYREAREYASSDCQDYLYLRIRRP